MMTEFVKEVTGKLVINAQARHWCKMPYPDHPYGCPNFNKKDGCPPNAPLVFEPFDLNKQHWFAFVGFDLEAHAKRMKSKHPEWSNRQARCCLYWQGTVRKALELFCFRAKMDVFEQAMLWPPPTPAFIHTDCPEAMGVDVFKTAEKVGILLERNPQTIVYKVALIGSPS